MSLEVMGPAFFMFFQVDPTGVGGQYKKPRYQRVDGTPEEIKNDNAEAIAMAVMLLFCNDE